MTIRDTINRQRESRESAERAKLERFAKAEAEARAILEAKAEAEELSIVQAKAAAKAAHIAAEKAQAEAKRLAKDKAKAEAKALKQAIADEKDRVRAEKNALAKADYEARTRAREEAKAAEKANALAESQARELETQEAKARAEAERQSLKLQKEQEAALEFKKIEAEIHAKQLAKETAELQAQQYAKTVAEEQAKAQSEAKARALEAAKKLLHSQDVTKAEAKKQAHEIAVLKAQERAAALSKLKAATKEKAKSLSASLSQFRMKIRAIAHRLTLYYASGNLRLFARIAYGVAILGVVGLMAQVFIDRYPQTDSLDILYEIPVEDHLAVIEADNHVTTTEATEPQIDKEIDKEIDNSLTADHVSKLDVSEQPSAAKNVTVSVKSTVAIIAPPKTEPMTEPDLKLANWQINAVDSDIPAGYPRLVIVLDDMGMSVAVSQKIARLPAPLTLAFLPYASRLPYQSTMVAEQGHELLVHMPMAPKNKRVNPGNNALLDDLNKKEGAVPDN